MDNVIINYFIWHNEYIIWWWCTLQTYSYIISYNIRVLYSVHLICYWYNTHHTHAMESGSEQGWIRFSMCHVWAYRRWICCTGTCTQTLVYQHSMCGISEWTFWLTCCYRFYYILLIWQIIKLFSFLNFWFIYITIINILRRR